MHRGNTKKSDVDLLVDFEKTLGLMKFSKISNEMSDVFDKKVDLVMRDALHEVFKDKVLKDSIPLYQNAKKEN